jgi:hypothetical protein
MKLHIALFALLLTPLAGFAASDPALDLYKSLSDEQRKEATLPLDAPERNSEVFTGGKRPGVQIRTLNEDQQKLAMTMLTSFTSDYGKQKALSIADQKINNPPDQPGFSRYYVCYFGEPAEGKSYAWRIAEHHLTLVQVEMDKGEPKTFGPILLGADPPTLWDEEEDKMIALYTAMTPDEREKSANGGKGISTAAFKGKSIKIGDLSGSAKDAAKAVVENRLSFFSDPVQKRVRALIDSNGGIDALGVAFFGEATKRCRDGGKWDFKLVGPSMLCDYENTRGHIHLSCKGKLSQ